jgi:hypothetical protein
VKFLLAMAIRKSKIIAISVFSTSFLAFFFGFLFNAWHVLEKDKFLANQAESLVLGRLVESRTNGIFAGGGLCGRCNDKSVTNNAFDYQYNAYKQNLPCKSFYPYLSQIAFHATVYSLIDRISPFSPDINLWILRAFKVTLLALVMSLIVYWFFLEFGLISAIFVFLGVLLTPWFTYLGRDLWFCVWTNFLPFVLSLFVLRREHELHRPSEFRILLYTCLAILINFIFNGYEWVSTTLVMATIPFFFYWRKDGWPFKKLLRRIAWIVAGSVISLFASFTVLVFQISQVKGKFSDGIHWLIFSFQKRSYGGADLPDVYSKQVDHPLWEVFLRYFAAAAFKFPKFMTDHLPRYFDQVYFAEVVFLFLVLTLLFYYPRNPLKLTTDRTNQLRNLAIVTWISILAPFSWYVIFKGHAWSHDHINFITWFMPFCLFGLAMTGATVSSLIKNVKSIPRKHFP